MAHKFARTRVDFAVERMDSVAEVRDESIEPLVSASTRSLAGSSISGLIFADGGCREEEGVFMGVDPLSKAVRLRSSGGQALEQSGVYQPTFHRQLPSLSLIELERSDINVMLNC